MATGTEVGMSTATHGAFRVEPVSYPEAGVRNEWLLCPYCDQEHPTELVPAAHGWIGFCRAMGRVVRVIYQEDEEAA